MKDEKEGMGLRINADEQMGRRRKSKSKSKKGQGVSRSCMDGH
jgi:hypothetical protein